MAFIFSNTIPHPENDFLSPILTDTTKSA